MTARTAMVGALMVLSVAVAVAAPTEVNAQSGSDDERMLRMRVKPLPDGVRRVWIEPDGQGGHWYVLELADGGRERVRPDELTARIEQDHRHRRWIYRLLNITSPVGFAWVTLGLLGQVLFTGRMLLQWLTSERAHRSVVPVGFWWMSLAGASMLLVYFIWRRDIVGVLGQSAGWLIYMRNLYLIYQKDGG
jgi:lipid-A-disaccharide synthase-like uncharacterized protein